MIKPKGYYQDDGSPILLMDADEVKEREDLNIANTTSARRKNVLEFHLKNAINNGHGITSS